MVDDVIELLEDGRTNPHSPLLRAAFLGFILGPPRTSRTRPTNTEMTKAVDRIHTRRQDDTKRQ